MYIFKQALCNSLFYILSHVASGSLLLTELKTQESSPTEERQRWTLVAVIEALHVTLVHHAVEKKEENKHVKNYLFTNKEHDMKAISYIYTALVYLGKMFIRWGSRVNSEVDC